MPGSDHAAVEATAGVNLQGALLRGPVGILSADRRSHVKLLWSSPSTPKQTSRKHSCIPLKTPRIRSLSRKRHRWPSQPRRLAAQRPQITERRAWSFRR